MKLVILTLLFFTPFLSFAQFKFQILGNNNTSLLSKKIFVKYKLPSSINYKSYIEDSCQLKNGKFLFSIDAKEPVLDFQLIIGKKIHYMLIDSGITNISIKKSTLDTKNYQLIISPSKSNDLFERMNELESNERKNFKKSNELNSTIALNFSKIKRTAELKEI